MNENKGTLSMTIALVDETLSDLTGTEYVGINPQDGEIIGVSDDAKELIQLSQRAEEHYRFPISRQDNLSLKFSRLVNQWLMERPPSSLIQGLVLHPAYQRIIGMGPVAIPFLLQELKRKPDHWFWALNAIAGVDPVNPEQRGKIDQMANAWLRWGREQGYIY